MQKRRKWNHKEKDEQRTNRIPLERHPFKGHLVKKHYVYKTTISHLTNPHLTIRHWTNLYWTTFWQSNSNNKKLQHKDISFERDWSVALQCKNKFSILDSKDQKIKRIERCWPKIFFNQAFYRCPISVCNHFSSGHRVAAPDRFGADQVSWQVTARSCCKCRTSCPVCQ